jgi:uncharacterized protein YprB with RNaseH-like and TPR domain
VLPSADAPSLADRIARASIRRGTASRLDDAGLAERLGGELVAGGVIELRHRFALGHRHGHQPLTPLGEAAADLPGAPAAGERLFLDTETSGLSGGTGTVAFLLGLARVDGEAFEVRQWLLTGFAGEPAMLAAAHAWGGEGGLVSYNGKCFDLPLLATRLRLHGERDPYSGRPHLDLLFPTRRAFASRWDDCRLTTVERRLLGFPRLDDIPGAEVPMAWFDWLHRGEWRRLAEVVRHNLWDLLSLAALLPALGEVYRSPHAHDGDAGAVARAWAEAGERERAIGVLLAGGDSLDDDASAQLAQLLRRGGDWDEAAAIWDRLAARGDAESAERLAKYHEHVRRDWEVALAHAQRLPPGPAREQRIARLRRKLQGQTPCG